MMMAFTDILDEEHSACRARILERITSDLKKVGVEITKIVNEGKDKKFTILEGKYHGKAYQFVVRGDEVYAYEGGQRIPRAVTAPSRGGQYAPRGYSSASAVQRRLRSLERSSERRSAVVKANEP